MDDELTEEEKRKRRAGDESEKMLDELAAQRAKTRPQWREVEGAWEMSVNGKVVAAIEPNNDTIWPECVWLSRIVTTEYPDHGWDAVDFTTLEDAQRDIEQWWHHARHGEAYRPEAGPAQASVANENNPERVAALYARDGREGAAVSPPAEPELGSAAHDAAVVTALKGIFAIGGPEPEPPQVTREAIERDPWNAVALDVPADASQELLYQVASVARDARFVLDDRADMAESPEQEAVWRNLAERAAERQTEVEGLILQPGQPMTTEAIRYDPWAAVYLDVPPGADVELLREAFDAARQCAAAVDGEQGPSQRAFEPSLLGAEESRETNFARADERVAELDGLIATRDRGELSLDDITERVQQLIDDPTRLAEESDQRVLDTLAERRAVEVVPERPAEEQQRLYQSTEEAESERSEPAPALDAATPQEMTDDAQIQYSRWTGERLSPETGPSQEAGHTLGGGGMGRSR